MTTQPPQYPGQHDPGQQYPGQPLPGQQPVIPGQASGFYGAPPQPPYKPRKPWFKRFWVWAVAIILIIGASQAFGNQGSSTTASDQQDSQTLTQPPGTSSATAKAPASTTKAATTQAKPTERLTLDKGWKVDRSNPFAVYVKGYVSNNSDKPLTNYAQITFDVLDKKGANLGTCLANTNTIDAHGKWRFEAICGGDQADVATVRFKEISGF